MEEILFKGNRIDNGKWVEGLLGYCNFNHGVEKAIFVATELGSIIPYRIKQNTIGQYTGLKDKNGKKIFEGDIISAITLDTGKEQVAVVCFGNFIDENNGDEYIGFFIEFDGIKTTITQLAMEECKNRIEVIGNIHDNPELLKEYEK